jgi:4,5:9,10-diseco-3-hydroxy-5,9,17-trioxoandrosta-1(10),2-diene-4-oate hydrolase
MNARVTVDGIELAYSDEGAGRPLVCLHAIGHDRSDYRDLRLGRTIALDWPGQGASGTDAAAPTSRRYAELLRGFLDSLHLDRVVLVGNSIGGAAAIRFAAEHPERVSGLVLMNPGGLDPGGRLARLAIRCMVAFFAAGARGRRWFRRAFACYYRQVLRRPAAAGARDRIIADGYRLAPLLEQAWQGFGEPDADLRALAPRVSCPTLFAWARHDRFLPLRRSRAAIARFPRARVELFDAGHAPQLETPQAFAAAVGRFLEGDLA